MDSRTEKATFLHHRLARPSTSLCGICGPRSRTRGPSAVCLKTNQRPFWAPGIPRYLPKRRASKHYCLLRKRPVFLFELTSTFSRAAFTKVEQWLSWDDRQMSSHVLLVAVRCRQAGCLTLVTSLVTGSASLTPIWSPLIDVQCTSNARHSGPMSNKIARCRTGLLLRTERCC